MTRITAEVFDCSFGQVAEAMRMRLDRADGDGWRAVARAHTSDEGRVDDWACPALSHGLYRITFDSDGYFAGLGLAAAYPEVQVIIRVREHDLCHVQVVLSPYSYSACIRANSAPASARPPRSALHSPAS